MLMKLIPNIIRYKIVKFMEGAEAKISKKNCENIELSQKRLYNIKKQF